MQVLANYLNFWNRANVKVRSDQEPSTAKLMNLFEERWSPNGSDLEHAPKYSSASLGEVLSGGPLQHTRILSLTGHAYVLTILCRLAIYAEATLYGTLERRIVAVFPCTNNKD